jgi:cytochrome c peroxidase
MNNADEAEVVAKVRKATYAGLFRTVYGPSSLDDVDTAYDLIADAIAEYERSPEVIPFTSKFDHYLAGQAQLTAEESRGMAVFMGQGRCANCHWAGCMGGTAGMGMMGRMGGMGSVGTMGMMGRMGRMGGTGMMQGMGMMSRPLFTDFGYRNLGVPANPANPFYALPSEFNPLGAEWVDLGLGDTLRKTGVPEARAALEDGKMKTPTLRNLSKTAPYMHNGAFATLEEVVHFYNTGKVLTSTMPLKDEARAPEVARNIQPGFVGNLLLTEADGKALIAFLETLTDGYVP